MESLDTLLESDDLQAVIKNMSKRNVDNDKCQWLVHVHVVETTNGVFDYKQCWPSKYVMEKVFLAVYIIASSVDTYVRIHDVCYFNFS